MNIKDLTNEFCIDIPGFEFNRFSVFERNIIIYNFNPHELRKYDVCVDELHIKNVKYYPKSHAITIFLNHEHVVPVVVTYKRFAQFINGVFDLYTIINKYDTRDKIVYSKDFLEYKPEMFTNSNVVVIKMVDNHKDMDGNEKKICSLTKNNYYLALKCHGNDKYKLLTLNNFERIADTAIHVTADFRFNEYKIERWEFTKNECYPIIGEYVYPVLSELSEIVVTLKTGTIFNSKNKFVEFSIYPNDSYDSVKYKLKQWSKYKHNTEYGRILQHTGPCNEIPLPSKSTDCFTDMSYSDKQQEFDPNEFLLNHKVNVVKKDIDLSLGMSDEFLSLL